MTLIKLRLQQLYKILLSAGIIRLLFILSVFAFTVLFIFSKCAEKDFTRYITGAYLLIVLSIHLKRQDILFLKITFNHYKILIFIEYILFSTPLFVSLLYHKNILLSSIYTVLLLIVAHFHVNYKKQSKSLFFQNIIPGRCFEWKSGLRQYQYIIVILWFGGLFIAFYFATVPLVLFILGMIILSFYEKSEPLSILIYIEFSTNKLLIDKIKTHAIIFSILTLPLIIAFIVFHTNYWYIVLIELMIFLTIHIFIVLSKYAYYEPNTITSGSQIMSVLAVSSVFIPFLIPVIWILSFYLFYKAKTNLNIYLNDFN